MIENHEKGTLIRIHVTSRSKHQSVSVNNDTSVVHVNVRAAPIRGKANREAVKLIARRLGISTSKIIILAGLSSPRKTVLIEGVNSDQVIQALGEEG